MANLKGPGAMTDVNLIARVYDSAVYTNEKTGKTTRFVDVMVDARDQRGQGDKNLHISTRKETAKDGKERYNNTAAYSADQEGQFAKMVEAAGPNGVPVLNKQGEKVGSAFAFKGSLMPASRGGLIVNTNKELKQSDFKMENDTLDKQFAAMKAAKAAPDKAAPAAEAQAETQAQAPAAEAAEPAQVENDEPAIG